VRDGAPAVEAEQEGGAPDAFVGASAEALARVRTWGLIPPSADSVELDPAHAAALLEWCRGEALEGVLWAAIEDGGITVQEPDRAMAAAAHLEMLRATLVVEATAAELTELLASQGIQARLIKGLAAAHLDSPEPAWRRTIDVDLLVARQDFARAADVLAGAGCTRIEPSLAAWWERRFGRAIVLRAPSEVEVDLHAAVAVGYFGKRLDHDALFALPAAPVVLGGVAAAGLHPTARLVATCYAAELGRGSGLRLRRDLLFQLRHPDCQWEHAVDLARAGDGEAVIARALLGAVVALGIVVDHPALDWAARVVPSRRARRALELAVRAETSGWSADASSTLLALHPWERVPFLAGVAVPPAEARRQRGRSLTDQARRAWSVLAGRR
jgi:hypothetical protein